MRRLVVIALLAVLVPLGCGGSDGNEAGSSRSPGQESTQADSGSDQSTAGSKSRDDAPKTDDGARSKSGDDSTQATGGSGTQPQGAADRSTPSQAAPGTTKKAFIAGADRVCRRYTRRLSSAPDTGDDADATVRLYRKVASQREKLYESFAALPKPSSDRALLARYVANLEKSVRIANQIADAVESTDVLKGPALIEASTKLEEQNRKVAVKYGFHVCRG